MAIGAGVRITAQGINSGRDTVIQTTIQQAALAPQSNLHQIPPPVADFTGREEELRQLHRWVEDGATVLAINGMGGTGKTQLALEFISEIAARFPDARLLVEMNGTLPQPTRAAEAMASVIRAWDITRRLPDGETELRSLYQSTLQGRHAIILLDNARDRAQVERLLPPAGCLLLLTSREAITLPGAQTLDLDQRPFPPSDAIRLLLRIEPRIGSDASRLAGLCGHLPLALRQAASTLRQRHTLAVADYLGRLERNRLAQLSEISAALQLSYELLPLERQSRFRALGVFTGDFDSRAAAALLGLNQESADDTLETLAAGSLLDWDAATRRYHLHDLVRDFAQGLLGAAEKEPLLLRHAAHYRDMGQEAEALYLKGGENLRRGLELFDRERAQIEAAFEWLQTRRDPAFAKLTTSLCNAVASTGNLRFHPKQQIRWLEAHRDAARLVGDRRNEGAALGNLGLAYSALGDGRKAIEFHEQGLLIAREIGDRRAEGAALGNLGNAHESLGDARKAIKLHEQELQIAREIGDRRGEGQSLGNLGIAHYSLGDARKAIEFYEQDLIIARETGNRRGEGGTIGNLGNAHLLLGDAWKSIKLNEQYLLIAREIRDRRGEGSALNNLGNAHYSLPDTRKAIEFYEQALLVSREIGDRRGEGAALGNLGNAHHALDDARKAIEFYQQALLVFSEIGDRLGEGNSLWNSADELWTLGEKPEAIRRAEEALRLYEAIEAPHAATVRKALERWRKQAE